MAETLAEERGTTIQTRSSRTLKSSGVTIGPDADSTAR
jgi:hypothetical protein